MTILAIRTVIIYIGLIAAMRMMGKRQIGELQPAELVVTMVISDVAAVPLQDEEMPLLCGLIPIMILVALELILSCIMLKSARFAELITGQPVVVVLDGRIDRQALKKLRMTVEDLCESLREQGVCDLSSVSLAVVETNGRVSIFSRREEPAFSPDGAVPLMVVSDGKLCRWAIAACGLSDTWVKKQIKNRGLQISDVLLMTADKNHRYSITKKEAQG